MFVDDGEFESSGNIERDCDKLRAAYLTQTTTFTFVWEAGEASEVHHSMCLAESRVHTCPC
eukprot:scaffold772_cov361-Prasinococcus_capsulatus_cf.AAC.9